MKRSRWLILSFILLAFPLHAESLAGYYLRFVRPEGVFDSLTNLVYVFCGLGSLFSLVMIYQKMQEGDHEAGKRARGWCISLFLIGVCTFIVSSLAGDYRSSDAINLGAALASTTNKVNGSFSAFSRLVYVACGIIGLMVLPGKFYAMQNGDRNAGRSITHWGLGLIATVAMVYIIHKIFFP